MNSRLNDSALRNQFDREEHPRVFEAPSGDWWRVGFAHTVKPQVDQLERNLSP